MKRSLIAACLVIAGVLAWFVGFQGTETPRISDAAQVNGQLNFPAAGISFRPPDGWYILSAQESARIMQNVDSGSDELDEMLRSPDPTLLIRVARDKTTLGVNPAISINLYPGEISDFEAAFDTLLPVLRQTSDFELLEGPVADPLGPFEAQRIRYKFSAQSSGVRLEVTEVLWLVPRGLQYLVVSSGAATEDAAELLPVLIKSARSLDLLN
ncbi:MAG: hypothetical protein AAGC79_02740 [Pseudomonadota bacterium]